MLINYKEQTLPANKKLTALLIIPSALLLVLFSCGKHKKVFTSTCAGGIVFKPVSFRNLVDSMKYYDKRSIEISGIYREGKGESALVNDSLFVDHSNSHAFWINFSQDCPLYLKGTRSGLFEYSDGKFTRLNNQRMTVKGVLSFKAHAGGYKASIDEISYIEF